MRCPTLLFIGLALASCSPRTGDALVDKVVSRVASFSTCLNVGQTRIIAESEDGPPALLSPNSFKNAAVKAAASRIARPWQSYRPAEPKFFGKGVADDCPTSVNSPAFSGEFAFLTYSEPGGAIGAFAFGDKGSGGKSQKRSGWGFGSHSRGAAEPQSTLADSRHYARLAIIFGGSARDLPRRRIPPASA